MNLNAFTMRDLQNCRAILTVLEGTGITDIPTARLRLAELERLNAKDITPTYAVKRAVRKSIEPCPSCGAPLHKCGVTGDIYCPKCRYSRLGGA